MSADNVDLNAPSSICTTGMRPYIMTGALLSLLRYHFSNPDRIVEEGLKSNTWSKDVESTRILIEPVYRWDARNIQQRPAVVVKRGTWNTQRIGIGDRVMGPPPTVGYGETYQTIAVGGTHAVLCLATSGRSAEGLGYEVAWDLMEFSEIIRRQLNLHRFQVTSVGSVARVDESSEHFAVPVELSYVFVHDWTVTRQSPIWSEISAAIRDYSGTLVNEF